MQINSWVNRKCDLVLIRMDPSSSILKDNFCELYFRTVLILSIVNVEKMNWYTQVPMIRHFQLHHHHHYLYWIIFTPFFQLESTLYFRIAYSMHFTPHTSQQFPAKRLNSYQCAMLWKYRHLFLGNFDVAKNRQDLTESIAKGKTLKKQKPWRQCSACNVTCENENKSTEWDFDVILPRFLMTCLHDKFHFLSVPSERFGCLDIDHEYFHRASCTRWLVVLQCVAPRDFVSLRIFRFSSLWLFIWFISYVSISSFFFIWSFISLDVKDFPVLCDREFD